MALGPSEHQQWRRSHWQLVEDRIKLNEEDITAELEHAKEQTAKINVPRSRTVIMYY